VSLTFDDNDRRICKENVMRLLKEIIAANTAAGKETLFDVCEYLRGRSFIEENESELIVVPDDSIVNIKDCPEVENEEATAGETEASINFAAHPSPATTVFQGTSASDNFAAACAAANAAAEKAASERREAATANKARENQLNYPQPGETSKAYYSRQGIE
jgi:hypothetical protein